MNEITNDIIADFLKFDKNAGMLLRAARADYHNNTTVYQKAFILKNDIMETRRCLNLLRDFGIDIF